MICTAGDAPLPLRTPTHPLLRAPTPPQTPPTEHKSERFRLWSFQRPHHMAFQFAWLTFFAAFVSTFAPAALLPVIRDNLDLVGGGAAFSLLLPVPKGHLGHVLHSTPVNPSLSPCNPHPPPPFTLHPQTKTDLGNAGIAAVVGAIAARVAMGNFIDIYGAPQPPFACFWGPVRARLARALGCYLPMSERAPSFLPAPNPTPH